jgi:hypothetical protein
MVSIGVSLSLTYDLEVREVNSSLAICRHRKGQGLKRRQSSRRDLVEDLLKLLLVPVVVVSLRDAFLVHCLPWC